MPFSPHQEASSSHITYASGAAITGTAWAAVVLSGMMLIFSRGRPELPLLASAVIVLGVLICLYGLSLCRSQGELTLARLSFEDRDREFRRLLHGTFDAVLVLDDQFVCQEANAAAAQLFGIDERHLVGKSIDQLAHDPTQARRLRRLFVNKPCRGHLELMRADGARLVAEFSSPAGDFPDQLLVMLRDRTALVRAEEAKARSLTAARSSLLEAYVLRKATSALAHSDPLNTALDNLLEILESALPHDRANILLLEDENRFISAHERLRTGAPGPQHSPMFNLDYYPWLAQALEQRLGILVTGAEMAPEGGGPPWDVTAATWICIPLFAAGDRLGFLSLARTRGSAFSAEDLRLSTAMAVPVALAVYNSRLHERAEIFRAELVQRLKEHPPS